MAVNGEYLNRLSLNINVMSKAEEFIRANTRRYSNHKELAANITGFEPWLSPYDAEQVAQIAREEVIEKACEWLKENVTYLHPRKGTEECVVNLAKFKEALGL